MAFVEFNYFGNIFVQENPVAYRKEVARYLDLIRTTESGQSLIKFIKMSARKLLIKPHFPTKDDPVNAFASPDHPLDAYPKEAPEMQAVKLGRIGTWLHLDPDTNVMLPTGNLGSGNGSTVTIEYHPATYREAVSYTHLTLPTILRV